MNSIQSQNFQPVGSVTGSQPSVQGKESPIESLTHKANEVANSVFDNQPQNVQSLKWTPVSSAKLPQYQQDINEAAKNSGMDAVFPLSKGFYAAEHRKAPQPMAEHEVVHLERHQLNHLSPEELEAHFKSQNEDASQPLVGRAAVSSENPLKKLGSKISKFFQSIGTAFKSFFNQLRELSRPAPKEEKTVELQELKPQENLQAENEVQAKSTEFIPIDHASNKPKGSVEENRGTFNRLLNAMKANRQVVLGETTFRSPGSIKMVNEIRNKLNANPEDESVNLKNPLTTGTAIVHIFDHLNANLENRTDDEKMVIKQMATDFNQFLQELKDVEVDGKKIDNFKWNHLGKSLASFMNILDYFGIEQAKD